MITNFNFNPCTFHDSIETVNLLLFYFSKVKKENPFTFEMKKNILHRSNSI